MYDILYSPAVLYALAEFSKHGAAAR